MCMYWYCSSYHSAATKLQSHKHVKYVVSNIVTEILV